MYIDVTIHNMSPHDIHNLYNFVLPVLAYSNNLRIITSYWASSCQIKYFWFVPFNNRPIQIP